jgi:hypothetical protein
MTAPSTRRARLLCLRNIEHRIAAAKLARADANIANLGRIAQRIAVLKAGLGASAGATNGMALNAMTEMTIRLDAARAGIVAPINEAEARRAEFDALRICARQKEESTAKLHQKALKSDAAAHDLRADANRPHRKRISHLEPSA